MLDSHKRNDGDEDDTWKYLYMPTYYVTLMQSLLLN